MEEKVWEGDERIMMKDATNSQDAWRVVQKCGEVTAKAELAALWKFGRKAQHFWAETDVRKMGSWACSTTVE